MTDYGSDGSEIIVVDQLTLGWMQYDDGVVVNSKGLIESIQGQPIDEER